jgi:hypothetical protein
MSSSPVNNLFIASEVRSGSTWIAELIAYHLEQQQIHDAFGLTKEIYSHLNYDTPISTLIDDFDGMWRDECGLATAKLMCHSISILNDLAQKSSEVKQRFFGVNSRWIVVRRRDRIAQAVSLAVARNSKIYHSYNNDDHAEENATETDLFDVNNALSAVIKSDVFLYAFTRNLPSWQVIEVEYESVMDRPDELLSSIYRLCNWPKPDGIIFDDRSKLIQTSRCAKEQLKRTFENSLLTSYHSIDEVQENIITSEKLDCELTTTHDTVRISEDEKWNSNKKLEALTATQNMDFSAQKSYCKNYKIEYETLAKWRKIALNALNL